MKRLIRKAEFPEQYKQNDQVKWRNHQYDTSVYTVTQVLQDGTLFIDNGQKAWTAIKPSSLRPAF